MTHYTFAPFLSKKECGEGWYQKQGHDDRCRQRKGLGKRQRPKQFAFRTDHREYGNETDDGGHDRR